MNFKTRMTLTFIITVFAFVSYGQKTNSAYRGVDLVTVYQDDNSDKIPKDKLIYQTAWGNTPDSLKPKFDIGFCSTNFRFPYYFPERKELTGAKGQKISTIENEKVSPVLRTYYDMTYDTKGRICKYHISGPSTIYSCDYSYDNANRIIKISDGWKEYRISYNDFGNIETIQEVRTADRIISKQLKFSYTYVAFQQH